MPYSSDEGKTFSRSMLLRLAPRTVLDVGPGSGTYGHMVRSAIKNVETLDAVEVFAPYIKQFNLKDVYDDVVCADIVDFVITMDGDDWWYDLIILGDVLEHLDQPDAFWLVEELQKHCRTILLSLPIVVWEQGAVDGNEHEAHLHHWTDDEINEHFSPYRAFVGNEIGVYLIDGTADANP